MIDMFVSGAKDLLDYIIKRKEKNDRNLEVNRIIRERNRLLKENKAKDEIISKQKIEIAKLKLKLKDIKDNSKESLQLTLTHQPKKKTARKLITRKYQLRNSSLIKSEDSSEINDYNNDNSNIPPAKSLI